MTGLGSRMDSLGLIFVGVLLFVTLGSSCGRNNAKQEQTQARELSEEVMDKYPNITISDSILNSNKAEAEFDFGRLGSGEVIEKVLIIKNSSKQPFVIEHIKVDCGCITVDYPEEPIQPGKRRTVRLTFNSKAQHGWVFKTVEFKTSVSDKTFKLKTTCEIDN